MRHEYDNIDLASAIAKVLYAGMFINVLIPGLLLALCYYLTNNYFLVNQIGEAANPLFYIFAVLAIGQAGLAIFWRGRVYNQPMIVKEENFETDLTVSLVRVTKPVLYLIASISLYGFLYFALTGRFRESLFMVLISFMTFQIVRPRYGLMRKLIDRQRELVKAGKFAPGMFD